MSSSDNSYQINILNNTIIYLYKYVLLVFYVIANIGNVLSFLIFFKRSWKKNVCVFYFKCCLLVNTCYINCNILANIIMIGFRINLQNSNIVVCKLYTYSYFLFVSLSPTILILASIDRLLISSQNVDTRLYSSKRLAYFSISLGTIFWSIFSFHALIKADIQEMYPSYFVCGYSSSTFYSNFVTYFYGVSNFVLCFVMTILCVIAFKNVYRIRAIPREQRHRLRSMTKKDFQLLRCLFVQDIMYIIVSTLLIIVSVYQTIDRVDTQATFKRTLIIFFVSIVNFLFNIYYSTYFFVFMIVSKAFRHEFKRLVYTMIGKDLEPIREEEKKHDNIEINVVSTIVLPT